MHVRRFRSFFHVSSHANASSLLSRLLRGFARLRHRVESRHGRGLEGGVLGMKVGCGISTSPSI